MIDVKTLSTSSHGSLGSRRPVRGCRQYGFTLIELMIVVAIIGILAAVATPVFIGYLRKSRTTEAEGTVRNLFIRMTTYRLETDGKVEYPPQFAETAPITPAASCCSVVGSSKCSPDPSLWSHRTWQALNFGMSKAHYYRYEIVTDNAASPPTFTISAYGDLDCDGVESTFRSVGVLQDGQVVSAGTPLKIRELE